MKRTSLFLSIISIVITTHFFSFGSPITFYNHPDNGNDLWIFLPLTGSKCTTQSTKLPLGGSTTIENMLSGCELKSIALAIHEPKNKETDAEYPIKINLYGQEITTKPDQEAPKSFIIEKKPSNAYTLRAGSLSSQ